MFRWVVTYDRYLCERRSGLTKHERVYFEDKNDASEWIKNFERLARNCCNFEIKEI